MAYPKGIKLQGKHLRNKVLIWSDPVYLSSVFWLAKRSLFHNEAVYRTREAVEAHGWTPIEKDLQAFIQDKTIEPWKAVNYKHRKYQRTAWLIDETRTRDTPLSRLFILESGEGPPHIILSEIIVGMLNIHTCLQPVWEGSPLILVNDDALVEDGKCNILWVVSGIKHEDAQMTTMTTTKEESMENIKASKLYKVVLERARETTRKYGITMFVVWDKEKGFVYPCSEAAFRSDKAPGKVIAKIRSKREK